MTNLAQESGVTAFERMRSRPPALHSNKFSPAVRNVFENIGAGPVEIKGPADSGITLLALKLAEVAAESGHVVILSCDGDVSPRLLADWLSPQAARNVLLLNIVDWSTLQLELALLPEMLCELGGTTLIIFDGLYNPLFHYERKRQEPGHQVSLDRHINQLLRKVTAIQESYNVLCLVTRKHDSSPTSQGIGKEVLSMATIDGSISALFQRPSASEWNSVTLSDTLAE